MSILRFFKTVAVIFNFVLGALGIFGYIWRPIFRAGTTAAPYWLVRLYSWLSPRGTAIMLALWVLFLLLSLIGRLTTKDGGKSFNPLVSTLRIGLIIAVIAAIPSFLVKHSHISSETYNSGNYNLLRETSFGKTSLMLVECTDPGQFSCRPIERANIAIPLPPTPMPTRVVVIEGVEVILAPNYIPTATPPVEFGIKADSGDLGIRVGTQWKILATPSAILETTPEPSE
ncbi:MAG: hypothetical protein ACI9EW_001063 [Cellvibrionaceae bacterium]|jgi:hypothetical protein